MVQVPKVAPNMMLTAPQEQQGQKALLWPNLHPALRANQSPSAPSICYVPPYGQSSCPSSGLGIAWIQHPPSPPLSMQDGRIFDYQSTNGCKMKPALPLQ